MLGKRTVEQRETFVSATELPKSPAHPFFVRLNQLPAEAGFDEFVECLCAPTTKRVSCISTRDLLPDALHRLLRGQRQPARLRLVVCEQPLAAVVPGRDSDELHPGTQLDDG